MKMPLSLAPSSHDGGNSQLHNYARRNGRKNLGCIASILRRILCIRSLPSSSFYQVKDDEKETNSLVDGGSSTPSVVAKLMGLESLPRIESFVQSPSVDLVKKSRSPKAMRYRKITPTYEELEDEHFFILSFDHDKGDEENIEIMLKERKSRKKRRRKKSSGKSESLLENWNKENEGGNEKDLKENIVHREKIGHRKDLECKKSRNVLVPVENSYEKLHSSPRTRKKVVQQDNISTLKLEYEAGSENSSPNSVLNFVEFPPDHAETLTSGDGISRLVNTKMRRTLSEVLKSFEKPEEEKRLIKDGCGEEEKQIKVRMRNRKKKNYYAEDKLGEIGELAAKEMAKMSWLDDELSKNRHHFKEIGRDLASEVLDQLLDELLI